MSVPERHRSFRLRDTYAATAVVRWRMAAFLLLVFSIGSALGQGALGQGEAHGLYEAGAFVQTYELALVQDTGAAQLLAARAALAYGLYETPSQEQTIWFERARDTAERAVSLAPGEPAPLLALAQARGELALRTDVLRNLNIAAELRDLIEAALALQPDHPDALVALGMWHLELTERGVGWLYGARREDVLWLVERGVAKAPENINLHVEYATALSTLGNRVGAREQLQIALGLPDRTAVDRYQHESAAVLLQGLEAPGLLPNGTE